MTVPAPAQTPPFPSPGAPPQPMTPPVVPPTPEMPQGVPPAIDDPHAPGQLEPVREPPAAPAPAVASR